MVPSAWLAWSARDWPHLGDGDRIASLPGAPAQTKYPPLYPLALASGLRLGLPLVALAWKVIAELGVDARIAVFLALNPFFALSGVSLLSEATFTCLLLAALIAAMRDRPVAAGAWAGLACLARSTGVVLLAAVPAAFLFRGRRRGAGFPVAAWTAWAHLSRSAAAPIYYTDYLAFYLNDVALADLPLLVWTNSTALRHWRDVAVAAIAGTVRIALRRGITAFHLFVAGYTALLLLWNYQPDQRFVLPIFALLLAGLWCELARIVAAVLIALGALAVQKNLQGLAVALLAYNDPLVYLHTGRRACRFVIPPMLLYRHDTARLDALYHRLPGGFTHVLLTPSDFNLELGERERAAALKILASDPRLKPLWRSEAASVYSVA